MKKIISAVLVAVLLTFSVFPTDKYEKIADKTCEAVTGKGLGLSTGEIIGIGLGAGVGLYAVGKSIYKAIKKDKYEDIADKAFDAIKDMN